MRAALLCVAGVWVAFWARAAVADAGNKRKFPSPEEQPNAGSKGGVDEVLKWSDARVSEAQREFDQTGFRRMPSPESWNEGTVYMVMVDRFANGDLANDFVNLPEAQKEQMKGQTAYDVGDWRHGGDLQGLRNRLGYLQELGISVIWVSPIFLQSTGHHSGYHMTDPSMIDPGFGSRELFRQLVHEAHERGMYIVLDVPLNMLTSPDFGYESEPTIDEVTACVLSAEAAYWNSSAAYPWNISNQSALQWGNDVPPYLRSPSFFQRCGSVSEYRPDGKQFASLPHEWDKVGATKYDAGLMWPENFRSPADMPDFATMEPTVQRLFVNLLNYWIAYADIDGLRFDAVKYISADYIAYVATKTRAFAASLGKNKFFLTGEILEPGSLPFLYTYLGHGPKLLDFSPTCMSHQGCIGLAGDCCPSPGGFLACCFEHIGTEYPVPQRVAETYMEISTVAEGLDPRGPGLPTIYPLDDHYWLRSLAQGNINVSAFGAQMPTMNKMLGQLQNLHALPEWTWTYADSQDITRLLQGKGQGADLWRLKPALVWMFTWRGIPSVYYGTEQGLNGQCQESMMSDDIDADSRARIMSHCEEGQDDSLKRQDLFSGGMWLLGSAVPSVQELAQINQKMTPAYPPHWCQEPLLDRENEAYLLTRALARIRKSCPLLSNTENLLAQCGTASHMGYWKVRDEGDANGPAAILVMLGWQKEAVAEWSISPPAAPHDKAVLSVARWLDLLDPTRTAEWATPAAGEARLVFKGGNGTNNYAVLIPEGDAQADEGATWQVCKAGVSRLPPLPKAEECRSNFMWVTTVLMSAYLAVFFWVFAANARKTGVFLCVVKQPSPVEVLEVPEPDEDIEQPKHIFVAAIEHTIPERKVKISAGGLGKVLDQMLREHPPARLSLMHPMFAGVDYGPLDYFTTLEIHVDMSKQSVEVHMMQSTEGDIHRVWYLVKHPWFETLISKDAPYPYPNTKLSVLRFFSLWNQAAAQLMVAVKADLYHCMDYHAAMAPLYIEPQNKIPTIIVLHNADYDGAIETEFISDVFWQTTPSLTRLSWIFNLSTAAIRKYCTFEGRFNMLWAGIACIEESQKGHGICTVSGKYAAELKRERTMFKDLPEVLPLDNAIDSAPDSMPKSVEELKAMRARSKQALQEFCGLRVDPGAKILIFVGRWVKQKGVDHIALLASRILDEHAGVQFVLAGPPGDPYGSYAQELLKPLAADYPGRIFVVTRFFMIPQDARAGAHFCLMPSCSEPFGYVDVEFGLLGVPSLGCAIGGLGKMPGVYFRQQNSDSQEMLLAGFSAAVKYALDMEDRDYWQMSLACIPAQFPFSTWRANLQVIYRYAQLHFTRDAAEANQSEPVTLNSQTFDKMLEDAVEERRTEYRHINSNSKGSAVNRDSKKVQAQLRRMQVAEASEFLIQSVSEERVRELMSYWMANDGRDTDAETLQRLISLGNQRMNERNFATRALMRSTMCQSLFGGDGCLRIHAVIALGYILSPVMDARVQFVSTEAIASNDYNLGILCLSIAHIGNVVGAFLWLSLSRAVPANLLMAVSLFLKQLLFSLSGLVITTRGAVWVMLFDFVCGVLTASRWLFLIWNFSEDFHGGFQVGTRRVALIETLRAAVAGVMTADTLTAPVGISSTVFSTIALLMIMLIMLAPVCYSSYVLPHTNFWRALKHHKVYMLLVASMSVNGLASHAWRKSATWLTMNGWTNDQVAMLCCGRSLIVVIFLAVIFMNLHRFSIWGPWIMRDITCFLPPGSLILVVAFWELGHLHYHSYMLLAAIVFAGVVDVARNAAMWTSILVTLANKWYALQGAFLGFAVIQAFEAASPIVTHFVGSWFGASPTWSANIPEHPQTDTSLLQKGTIAAVVPFSLCAYFLQMAARRYFLEEVLTYKGSGNLMPDGTKGWSASETAFVWARNISSAHTIVHDDASEETFSSISSDSDDAEETNQS